MRETRPDPSFFEWATKQKMGNCTYVGSYCASKSKILGCIKTQLSYCCYDTPLARIIQEQARPQLGLSWGPAQTPNCRGLTTTELTKIDWSKVDLSEWINILKSTGNLPGPGTLNVGNATGVGSNFDTNGARLNTLQRTQARLNGQAGSAVAPGKATTNQINNKLSQSMW